MRTGAWISELGSQHTFVVELAPSVGKAWSAEHLFLKRVFFYLVFQEEKKYFFYSVLNIVLYFFSLMMYMMT